MTDDNKLVIINYEDLLSDSEASFQNLLEPLLHRAFGNDGNDNDNSHASLGLIAIRGIPSFVSAKSAFLPLAHDLVHLPPQYLEENLTDEASFYSSGYSHGKEKLGNHPDLSKASFYFNPVTDVPGTQEDRENYPASYPINKWPNVTDAMKYGYKTNGSSNTSTCTRSSTTSTSSTRKHSVEDIERYGKAMGCLMKNVVVLLSKHVDRYIMTRCRDYVPILKEKMTHTEKVKGRLLYYFPLDRTKTENATCGKEQHQHDDDNDDNIDNGKPAEDSWIGWHNDSGFFTALSGDIYVDHDTGEIIPKDEIDPNAGLYIMDRNGKITHVNIPDDCMVVQIGECLQIISGGTVVATPHCVRGVDPSYGDGGDEKSEHHRGDGDGDDDDDGSSALRSSKVARISFPCFVDTVPSFPLKVPNSTSREEVIQTSVKGCAEKVPPLERRWTKDGMDFGSFLHDTFAMYYEWSNQKD